MLHGLRHISSKQNCKRLIQRRKFSERERTLDGKREKYWMRSLRTVGQKEGNATENHWQTQNLCAWLLSTLFIQIWNETWHTVEQFSTFRRFSKNVCDRNDVGTKRLSNGKLQKESLKIKTGHRADASFIMLSPTAGTEKSYLQRYLCMNYATSFRTVFQLKFILVLALTRAIKINWIINWLPKEIYLDLRKKTHNNHKRQKPLKFFGRRS